MIQLPLFPEPLSSYRAEDWYPLRFEKDARFYEVILHQDLWGQWFVTKRWGSGEGSAQTQLTPCKSYAEVLDIVNAAARRCQRQGYIMVTPLPEGL
ncbi:MAG: hypothetical protein ACFCBW_20985 [Candidatus Competibacterales bacterium]